MGYVIAAYGVVIGSLVVYGLWIQSQRRGVSEQEAAMEARAAASRVSDPSSEG
ncbi:hypothetical protein MK489_15200 [Myxococcota bacterium]|nr:hypothetical protein [Myxococcota bacterium]